LNFCLFSRGDVNKVTKSFRDLMVEEKKVEKSQDKKSVKGGVQNSTANKERSSKKSIESPKSYSNTKPQQAAPSKSSSNLFR
jgi:hypothetical protein